MRHRLGAVPDAPRDGLTLRADLHELRRVGDEGHFFFGGVDLHGHRYDIDTHTIRAPISMFEGADNYVVGKIAVLRAADADDGSPGAWLACGVFARTDGR